MPSLNIWLSVTILACTCSCCLSCFNFGLTGKKSIHLGCYVESEGQRDLLMPGGKHKDLTIDKCNKICLLERSAKYFGLQNGHNCWCGFTYGRHGKADYSACYLPCAGNNQEICGGKTANSVYMTYRL